MSEPLQTRPEPIRDPGPPPPVAGDRDDRRPDREVIELPPPARADGGSDQLNRLEDKAARIEEKLARFEANTQRVVDRFELASARMNEVALQSDLAAVRGETKYVARRVRNLPGLTALAVTAIVTALLTAALTAVIIRYLPGGWPR